MKPWEVYIYHGDKTTRLEFVNKAGAVNKLHSLRDFGLLVEDEDRFAWVPPHEIRGASAREIK